MIDEGGACHAEAGRCVDPSREGGFSIVEAVIAAGLMLVVTASVFAMMRASRVSSSFIHCSIASAEKR